MSEKSEVKELTEEEKRGLPTFDEYCMKTLETRENFNELRRNIMFFALFADYHHMVETIRKLSVDSQLFLSTDPEWQEKQKVWDYLYGMMTVIQSFMLRWFCIREPNWDTLKPINYWLGVMVSAEDFNKYILRENSPFHKLNPETMKSHMDETNEKDAMLARLKQAYLEDPEGTKELLMEESKRMQERLDERRIAKKASN